MGIRDKSGSRSGSIHTSEHSLPEKLSQALKALRPGVLSQSSSGSSPFASKSSGVVDADDVIYYTSTTHLPMQESNSYEKKSVKGRIFGNTRKSKSVFTKHSSPSKNDIAQFNIKSLDQIRHLYKSAPNVSSFDDGDATPGTSRRCIDDHYAEIPANNLSAMRSRSNYSRHSSNNKNFNGDAFTATSSSMSSLGTSQSPTDSGYRSTPRHLFASGIESKPPPLPSNPPPLSSPEPYTYLPRKPSVIERDDRLDKSPMIEKSKKDRDDSIYASTPALVQANSRKPSMCKPSPPMVPVKDASLMSRKISMASSDDVPVKLPIDDRDVLNVLQKGRCKQHSHFVTLGAVPKLTSALTVPLLRICTETSRLAKPLVKCTMNDIKYATMLCLPESVAEDCIKAAVQATTLYALSGAGALRISMSRRAGLNFSVGNFYRWMIDSHVANVVTDIAAVYLCAVMECFLERLLAMLSGTIGKTESVTEENFDRLIADYLDVCRFMQAHEVKDVNKHNRKLKQIVCAQTEADLRTILDHLYRKLHTSSTLFEQNRRRSKNALYFGKQAISSLFYFTRCKGRLCGCQNSGETETEAKIYDWLRFILHFVDHRFGMHVDQQDVLQAARILLPNVDCPPYSVDLVISSPSLSGSLSETKRRKQDMGMALLLTAEPEFMKDAYHLIGPQKQKAVNDYGLTTLAQAVIIKNEEAVSFLIENNADINAAIPADGNGQHNALSLEFAGWSPLSWAVAFQDTFAIGKLLEIGADVDEIYMNHETPLQIATMIGDSETFSRLISCGANAFSSAKSYDSLTCNIRNIGSPSALAVAAAFARREFVSIMLSQSRLTTLSQNNLTLTDFLNESRTDGKLAEISSLKEDTRSSFKKLPKMIQKSSQEALYYAVETSRSDIVMQFKQLGVPWNIHTWTRCLQVGYDNHDRAVIMTVLKDFSSKLIDELSNDIIDDIVAILFDVIRYESRQAEGGKLVVAAKIISKLNQKFSKDNLDCISQSNRSISVVESGTSTTSATTVRPIIDPKYADNPELSDIRFKVEDKIIYAHRIVLVNASESFKRLLDGPSGVIELDNITYDVFKILIDHMYGNRTICRQKLSDSGYSFQLDVMEASLTFGLDQLTQECHDLINSEMSSENCARIYHFAQRCGVQTLIEDAENYILQNFVSLMDNDQIILMLQRSGQPGWCDLCAVLANRLVEAFESFISYQRNKHT